jgi:hypothetical protein
MPRTLIEIPPQMPSKRGPKLGKYRIGYGLANVHLIQV